MAKARPHAGTMCSCLQPLADEVDSGWGGFGWEFCRLSSTVMPAMAWRQATLRNSESGK